jgi:hypothetical protein
MPETTGAYRLFGIPDSETLWPDLGAAYEQQVEWDRDESGPESRIIEEWTVAPPTVHLRDAAGLVEWLLEDAADNAGAEGYYDDTEHLARDPELVALADALIAGMASRITYRVADRRVAEHVITWNADDEPLVGGFPLYVQRPETKGDSPSPAPGRDDTGGAQ